MGSVAWLQGRGGAVVQAVVSGGWLTQLVLVVSSCLPYFSRTLGPGVVWNQRGNGGAGWIWWTERVSMCANPIVNKGKLTLSTKTFCVGYVMLGSSEQSACYSELMFCNVTYHINQINQEITRKHCVCVAQEIIRKSKYAQLNPPQPDFMFYNLLGYNPLVFNLLGYH